MICYKDTTFCVSKVKNHTCSREFTKKDAKEAEKWWGGSCVNCTSTEKLEFDHVMCDGNFKIGNHLLNSLEYVLPELQKCQLLCRSCHKVKTTSDLGRNIAKHGTPSMYTNQKCRCDMCKSAWSRYVRPKVDKWRKNQKIATI